MNDIFISYSRKDREIVKKLVEVFKGRGWNVWWDPTIRPGEYYEDVIETALTESKCVVVVWSKNSVKSKWVRAEAAEAANRDVLVPVVIDDAKIPFRFKQIQEAHLGDWQDTPDHPELVKLLDSIAEKFIRLQEAQDRQLADKAVETEANEAIPLQPPIEQKSKPATLKTPAHESSSQAERIDDAPADDYQESYPAASPADSASNSNREEINQRAGLRGAGAKQPPAPLNDRSMHSPVGWHSERQTPRYGNSQAREPVSAQPHDEGYDTGDVKPPSPITSKIYLVAALFIASVLVGGAVIYFAALRGPASSGNDNRADKKTNQQGNAINVPATSTTTPGASPSPTATPAISAEKVKKIAGLVTGKWQVQNAAGDCSCGDCLNIQFNRTDTEFCVESNQIYVSAYYRLDAANNKVYLFFKEPTDLGAGGNAMPWTKIDRQKPLATIDLADLESQRIIYVTWHGFTETGAARQRWRTTGSSYQGTYMKF